MIQLRVLYDEGDPSTYRGIELRFKAPYFNEHQDVFNTGVPIHDYLTAVWAIREVYGEDAVAQHTSSYDNFSFDGGDLPEEGFTDKQLSDARRAALLFLGPKYDLKMIQFLAEGLNLEDLRKASEGIGGLYGERYREDREARKARLVPMTPDELVAFHQPTFVRLDLNTRKLPAKYTKAIKAMGGRYSHCRGDAILRSVDLPLTDEGIELGNKLWEEFFTPGWGTKGPAHNGTMVLDCPGTLLSSYRVIKVPRAMNGVQVALELFEVGLRFGAEAGQLKRMKDPLEVPDEKC